MALLGCLERASHIYVVVQPAGVVALEAKKAPRLGNAYASYVVIVNGQ